MTVVHHATEIPEDAPFSPRAATPARAGKPRRKPEAEVVAEALAMLRNRPATYARKVHGGAMGNVGEPDLDAVSEGRAIKLEAKAEGKRPEKAQVGALRRWAKAGALVGWFTCNDHIQQLLDHLHTPGFVPDLDHPGCSCTEHGGHNG